MNQPNNLLGLLLQLPPPKKLIVSVSSGVLDVDNKNVIMKQRFANILKDSCEVIIKSFTEKEAEELFLSYRQIKRLSGTNPHLLSCIGLKDNYGTYKGKVENEVQSFLQNNLGELQATSTSLADYLKQNKIMKSKIFAYYACRGDALKDSEVIDYYNTWFCQKELTMLEEVSL